MCIENSEIIEIFKNGDLWQIDIYETEGTASNSQRVPKRTVFTADIKKAIDHLVFAGNAIKLTRLAGLFKHWVVCFGKNEEGDIIVIHRDTTTGKKSLTLKGYTTTAKLKDLLNPETLDSICIYRCFDGMLGWMCRSVAISKAVYLLNSANSNYYNPFTVNCENLAFECCTTTKPGILSPQAFNYTSVLVCQMVWLILLAVMGLSIGEWAASVFIGSVVYILMVLLKNRWKSELYFMLFYYNLYFDERELDKATSKLSTPFDEVDFKNSRRSTANEDLDTEKRLLAKFYYTCQVENLTSLLFEGAMKESEKLKQERKIENIFLTFLLVKCARMTRLSENLRSLSELNNLSYEDTFESLAFDFKVFVLALGEAKLHPDTAAVIASYAINMTMDVTIALFNCDPDITVENEDHWKTAALIASDFANLRIIYDSTYDKAVRQYFLLTYQFFKAVIDRETTREDQKKTLEAIFVEAHVLRREIAEESKIKIIEHGLSCLLKYLTTILVTMVS